MEQQQAKTDLPETGNLTLSPALEYNNRPIRALITSNGQLFINAEDISVVFGADTDRYIINLDAMTLILNAADPENDIEMMSLASVYRMMAIELSEGALDWREANAFDLWLIESFIPALLALHGEHHHG